MVVEAVHVELGGSGHHQVLLCVIEEVAVHGEFQARGGMGLPVHRIHPVQREHSTCTSLGTNLHID